MEKKPKIDSNDSNSDSKVEENKKFKTSSWQKDHPREQIIGDPTVVVQTRRVVSNYSLLYNIEPKNVVDASKYESWMKAINEELDQIEKNKTWELVPRPTNKNVIGTKWVF